MKESSEYCKEVSKHNSNSTLGHHMLLPYDAVSEFVDNALCKECVEEDMKERVSEEKQVDIKKLEDFALKRYPEKVSKVDLGVTKDYKRHRQ